VQPARPPRHLLPGPFWLTLLVLVSAGAAQASGSLPSAELVVGDEVLTVEIAATERSRRVGLMHRDALPADHGMLFVWHRPAAYGMWMQNTRIPLDVAFIDADYSITNIATMEPRSARVHSATRPVLYALEVNAGWFDRHGIGAGHRIPDLQHLLAGHH
jgi:uncharacterized membrane protein (UPF0127 family)